MKIAALTILVPLGEAGEVPARSSIRSQTNANLKNGRWSYEEVRVNIDKENDFHQQTKQYDIRHREYDNVRHDSTALLRTAISSVIEGSLNFYRNTRSGCSCLLWRDRPWEWTPTTLVLGLSKALTTSAQILSGFSATHEQNLKFTNHYRPLWVVPDTACDW